MPNEEVEPGRVVQWSGETYRLIPSRFPPVSVYEGLVANDRIQALVKVEDLTNPRLRSQARIAQTCNDEARSSAKLQNWNLAPFAYGNPEGSVFFGEERPCLELSADRQTALAVSVARRQKFLERTCEAPIGLDMRMLKTPISGHFWDLRSIGAIPDRKRRLELGAIMPEEADGILFRPEERPSATCISVIRGDVLGASVQTVHYRYMWNGSRISLLYAFDEIGRQIEPATLGKATDVLAA